MSIRCDATATYVHTCLLSLDAWLNAVLEEARACMYTKIN